jgi:ferredoxin-nitrate reductase
MAAQLDAATSLILQDELAERGIRLHLQESIASVHGEESVLGVRTASGKYLPCDLLVYAVGTRPNTGIAKDGGLRCGVGVVVDVALRTSDPDIYAMGEVAEHRGQRHGTTYAAQQQATIAAAQVAGLHWRRYEGSIALHIVKVPGLQMASLGRTAIPAEDAHAYEQIIFDDPAERYHQRCIVYRNRLVGAVMAGDISQMDRFKALAENGTELDEERKKLLRQGGPAAAPPKGRIVCSCCQVGIGNIADAIAAGCTDVPALCNATRAGTGCGSCRPELQHLLQQAQEAVA